MSPRSDFNDTQIARVREGALFGGASITARSHNFDGHWRNLRKTFNHDPLLHKARVIGDYELNGVTTHLTEERVFCRFGTLRFETGSFSTNAFNADATN